MPVGTGSLQRAAAKASDAAEEGQKRGPVKNAAVKEKTAKKENVPKINTVYHLTEELPFYLL